LRLCRGGVERQERQAGERGEAKQAPSQVSIRVHVVTPERQAGGEMAWRRYNSRHGCFPQ
jgi:hypothetical protein